MSKKNTRKKTPVKPAAENKPFDLSFLDNHYVYLGIILVLLLVLFSQVVFLGKGPVASDTVSWKSAAHVLQQHEEKTGETPLWNPNIFGGMPAYMISMKNLVPNFDTIITAMDKLFGFPFIYFLVAGISLYFFLGYLGIGKPASLFGALTFIFTPHFFSLIEAGHNTKLRAILYLPVVLFAVYYMLKEKNLLSFVLAAIALAIQLRAKHPQIVYYTWLSLGVMVLMQLYYEFREGKKPEAVKTAIIFGLSVIAALALVAQPYFLTYEYSHYTMRGGSSGLATDYALNWSFSPGEMLTFLVPEAFGMKSPFYWGPMPFTSTSFYMGLIPFMLAIVTIAWRRDKFVWFLIITTVAALLLSFGRHFALLSELMLNYFPFYNKFRAPSMILFLVELNVALLAALGLHFLITLEKGSALAQKMADYFKYLMFAGLALLLLSVLTRNSLVSIFPTDWFIHTNDPARYSPEQITQMRGLRAGNLGQGLLIFSGLLFLSSMMVSFYLRDRIKSGILSAGLVVLLVADLWYLDFQHFSEFKNVNRWQTNYFQANDTDKFLQSDPGLYRILPAGDLFGNNRWSYYHQSLGGYSAAKMQLIQDVIEKNLYKGWDKQFPLNTNILKIMNVKYMVLNGALPADLAGRLGFMSAFNDGKTGYRTYRFDNMLPRAYFVGAAETGLSMPEISSRLNSPDFKPDSVALISGNFHEKIQWPVLKEVTLSSYDIHNIVMETKTDADALLVLSEVYYPAGWNAYIDGLPTEIYQTNYLVRSVFVPAGTHRIEFRFEPETFTMSLAITWSATIVLLLLAGFVIYRLRKKPAIQQEPNGEDHL